MDHHHRQAAGERDDGHAEKEAMVSLHGDSQPGQVTENRRRLSLSPFLNHGPPKISNDSLVPVDGLVDRRFPVPPNIWKGERMPQHRFPLPIFLG